MLELLFDRRALAYLSGGKFCSNLPSFRRNINATAGTAAIANMAVVPLTGSTSDITVAYGVAGGVYSCDVAIDVTGYYQ